MARARNIKPGFFANEMLAECDPLARLLFAGLWCLADREGRLEDRPKRIRAEVLPYDACDPEELLTQLEKHGFILRYAREEQRFIQVLNFGKHQNPHIKEAKSTIPAPFSSDAETGDAQDVPTPSKEQAPDQHSAGTVQAPDENQKSRADSGFSDSLIPDSLIPCISVAIATGGQAANAEAVNPPKLTDPSEIIFGYGLSMLTNAGTAEKQARSFLGGLRKVHGDSVLVDKLRECAKARPLQPLEWLAAALPPPPVGGEKGARPPNKQEALEARNRAVGEEWERKMRAQMAQNGG